MATRTLEVRRCQVEDAPTSTRLEAVCVGCGDDLVVVVGGGERYHVGAAALAISIPSLKDPSTPTTSSYLAAVPGHKEEELARGGALRLSRALHRHVVMTVGIHDDGITKERVAAYVALFERLVDEIARGERAAAGRDGR